MTAKCPACHRPVPLVLADRALMVLVDPDEVYWKGIRLDLSPRLCAILSFMARRGGELSSAALEMIGVGEESTDSTAAARVQMHNLRDALSTQGVDFHIETIRGWGYRIADGAAPPIKAAVNGSTDQ